MSKRLKNMFLLPRCFNEIIVFAFLYTLLTSYAQAQTGVSLDQLFTIRDIRVDETALSADRARSVALLKAEEEAYEKLLRKITQQEHRDHLPKLSTLERQALISGIELVEEQSSDRRYLATLNVRFEADRISTFLAQHGVPHVLGTGSDILVLHVHKRGLSEIFWEKDNQIEQARAAVDWVNRIRGYRFPRGEMKERVSVSAREVAEFDTEAALLTSQINNLDSVLMISSFIENDAKEGARLVYRFISTDSGVGSEGAIAVLASNGDNAEAKALIEMYDQILEEIDGAWRERLLVDTGSSGSLEVVVPSISLENVASVEKKLSEISLVQGYQVRKLGLPTSVFVINYTGRRDQLVLALGFAGLDLKPYGTQMILEQR